ncbi:MAG: pyridoxal-dependent decarboxylase [Cyclobacteriaceae bacterium]|nr:pyridoxal-dependent decarboxylase [Cyclobacteriaceae bacterium]
MGNTRLWKKLTSHEIKDRVANALKRNINFYEHTVFGVPASHLDGNVFYNNAPFLADAPFLSSLVQNPNHIGCHTMGNSEPFFQGTQAIEEELIRICAEDIFEGEPYAQDGYVASGGTEANIQAIWMHRNYFMKKMNAKAHEIAIICSSDSHYSMHKASDLLQLSIYTVPVDFQTREIAEDTLMEVMKKAKEEGIKYGIVVVNMMTTMFGSVDSDELYVQVMEHYGMPFRIHIDGAFGGFVYPFSNDKGCKLSFKNKHIHSITLDAHKMVQAPYGTGIFLTRKGMMEDVLTDEAQYVKGMDSTLSGSRSGANAIAVWMILSTYGPHGWFEKISLLIKRATWLSNQLTKLGIRHYRHPMSNIITMQSEGISKEIAGKYGLVPDDHHAPKWYKIVVMEHVTVDGLEPFVEEVREKIGV